MTTRATTRATTRSTTRGINAVIGAASIPPSVWTLADLPSEIAAEYFAAIVANGGTISSGNQTKVDTLLNALYDAGIYRKVKALYLYHGNTLNAARLNTMNPTTYPGSGLITWTGTPTLDAAGGMTPSSGNYGLTEIHPDGWGFTYESGMSLGFWGLSNVAEELSFGVINCYISPKDFGGYQYVAFGAPAQYAATVVSLTEFHCGTREPGDARVKLYRNATKTIDAASVFDGQYQLNPAALIKVGGVWNPPLTHYASTLPLKCSFIADGLTAAEKESLRTVIASYAA